MIALALLLLVPGDVDVIDSKDFPKEAQVRALTAVVRVVNSTGDITGSGVLLRRSGPVVYVLTAAHVVSGAVWIGIRGPNKEQISAELVLVGDPDGVDLALVELNGELDQVLQMPIALVNRISLGAAVLERCHAIG